MHTLLPNKDSTTANDRLNGISVSFIVKQRAKVELISNSHTAQQYKGKHIHKEIV